MIIRVCATLGVFLLLASRDPEAYRSIIWFTVWSSVVHAAIMTMQSFGDSAERGDLVGDVSALLLVALALGLLAPRGDQSSKASKGLWSRGARLSIGASFVAGSMRTAWRTNSRTCPIRWITQS